MKDRNAPSSFSKDGMPPGRCDQSWPQRVLSDRSYSSGTRPLFAASIALSGKASTVSVQSWDGIRLGLLPQGYKLAFFFQITCTTHVDFRVAIEEEMGNLSLPSLRA